MLIAGRLGDVDPEAANPELTIAVGETCCEAGKLCELLDTGLKGVQVPAVAQLAGRQKHMTSP